MKESCSKLLPPKGSSGSESARRGTGNLSGGKNVSLAKDAQALKKGNCEKFSLFLKPKGLSSGGNFLKAVKACLLHFANGIAAANQPYVT